MAKKILFSVVLFALVLSIVISLPQVYALQPRTVFDNAPYTASFGNSPVCGDHKCALGEKPQWTHATWGSQRVSSGKLPPAYHGEDIMSQLAKSSPSDTSMHGTVKISHP